MNSLHEELLAKLSLSWHGIPDKPDENPEKTLRALWLYAAGKPKAIQHIENTILPYLDEVATIQLRELVDRRISGIPLGYLTHRQSFMGIELITGPEAMIPRKETEILGRAAFFTLEKIVQERGFAQVIDLCTGSGNLALTLASHVKSCKVIGADLSEEGLKLANRNAEHLGLTDRVAFRQSDLFTAFESDEFWGQVDMVVCNPPYISSLQVNKMPSEISDFEPCLAFDGGAFGVGVLIRLIRTSPRFLKPHSWLCFEVGLGQHEGVHRILERTPGYSDIGTYRDEQGAVRAFVVRTCPDT